MTKFFLPILFIAAVAATATATSESGLSLRGPRALFPQDPFKRVQHRIVGGEQSEEGEFPYYVQVGYGCGGALIAPQVVLYAAHCAYAGLGEGTSVQVGAYKAHSDEFGYSRTCERVINHPQYNSATLNNDFSLCLLDSPVNISEERVVLALNEDGGVPETGEDLIVLGLGRLSSGGNSPEFLHNVTVPTVSNEQCNEPDYYNDAITDEMLCAGIEEGGIDSCQGDSGGPIVRRTYSGDGKFVDEHVGVVSWGYGCAAPKKPGVYARTSSGHGWIKNVVCNDFNAGDAEFCATEPPTPTVSPQPTSAPVTPSPTTGPPTLPPISLDPVPVKSECPDEAGQLQIKIQMDQYGYETTWYLEEKDTGRVVAANQAGYEAYSVNFEPPRKTKNSRGPAKSPPSSRDNALSLRGRDRTGLSPSDINNRFHNRIINGEQSEEGEFPYYVQVGYGCGGALIAPQVVLYAAHCAAAGLNEGTSVQVGAYKRGSDQYGYSRTCESVINHPAYNDDTLENDFSLCLLDSPVPVDESYIQLDLNEDENDPEDGEDLIVLGLGVTESGNVAQYLQNVTVPTISNEKCNKGDYYGGMIKDSMLCAGYEKGQMDSCQGDSGGPIVKRTYAGDGKFVDKHVGVVSWGYGCAEAKKPGVYARTSFGLGWIKNTVCSANGFGVEASFCSGDEPDDDSDDDVGVKDMYYCLDQGKSYLFNIHDTWGDGLSAEGNGYAKLYLNDKLVTEVTDDDEWKDQQREFTVGGGEPTPTCEDMNVEIKGKSNGCKKYVSKGKKKKIKKKCKKKEGGTLIHKLCPKTCGKVGVGKCKNNF